MDMHQWLAAQYDNEPQGTFEKTAGLDLLVKLAEEEGVDLDTLSDEEVSELASELQAGSEGEEAAAVEEPEEEEEQEAQGDESEEGQGYGDPETDQKLEMLAKMAADAGVDVNDLTEEQVDELLAEMGAEGAYEEGDDEDALSKEAEEQFETADFLGRTMAHAMTQELRLIKEAGAAEVGAAAARIAHGAGGAAAKASHGAGRLAAKASNAAGKGAAKVVAGAKRYGQLMIGGKAHKNPVTGKVTRPGNTARVGKHYPADQAGSAEALHERIQSHRARGMTAAALVGGGVTAAALKARKNRKQEESEKTAADVLSERIAFEKVATERALEMLIEAGYPVE